MRRFLFLLIVLSACHRPSAPQHLAQEAQLLSETVKMLWLNDGPNAPDNVLFVNVKSGSDRPPQLDGLILNPSTSIEYLYVRTWVASDGLKHMRRISGAFVLKDLASGSLVRGSIRDGVIRVEAISRYQFQKLLSS